jgi:two-component system, chemotaxis family, protein-glutamate methylesterase/glutaminase
MKYEAVIIGGSSGSMEITIALLKALRPSYPLPVIIILHRLKNSESTLDSILKMSSQYKNLKEADEKEKIRPGFAYIAPANYHLLIEDDRTFTLDDSELVNYSRPSIDVSFQSASAIYKEKLIGILLTGANADGAEGMRSIKERGGLTIVQDPTAAQFATMPQSAINATSIDHILNINEIAPTLKKLL